MFGLTAGLTVAAASHIVVEKNSGRASRLVWRVAVLDPGGGEGRDGGEVAVLGGGGGVLCVGGGGEGRNASNSSTAPAIFST